MTTVLGISISLSYFRVRAMKFASQDPNSLRFKIKNFLPPKSNVKKFSKNLVKFEKCECMYVNRLFDIVFD